MLMSGVITARFVHLRRIQPSFSWLQERISAALSFLVVPLVLFFVWARCLPVHEFPFGISLWHVTVLSTSLLIGRVSRAMSRDILERRYEQIAIWNTGWKCFRFYKYVLLWIMSVGVISLATRLAVTGVDPATSDHASRTPSTLVVSSLLRIGFPPFAILSDSDISTKPADWSGSGLKAGELGAKEFAGIKGASLRNKDLRNARIQHAFLVRADLRHARLDRANLAGAQLMGAQLEGANLTGVDLEGSDLRNAVLTGVNLSYAQLDGTNLGWSKFDSVNLDNARLSNVNLTGVDLDEADIRGIWFLATDFRKVVSIGDQSNTHHMGSTFNGMDLNFARFEHADIFKGGFAGAKLENADFNGASLSQVSFRNSDLTGSDLTHAEFGSIDLRGANLRGVKGLTQAMLDIATTDTTTSVDLPLVVHPHKSFPFY